MRSFALQQNGDGSSLHQLPSSDCSPEIVVQCSEKTHILSFCNSSADNYAILTVTQHIKCMFSRVLTGTKRSEQILPAVKTLASQPQVIDLKVLVLIYKSLNGLGPEYINEMLMECQPSTTFSEVCLF